jgi:hypothetical protein
MLALPPRQCPNVETIREKRGETIAATAIATDMEHGLK